jgi:hypothetical protein
MSAINDLVPTVAFDRSFLLSLLDLTMELKQAVARLSSTEKVPKQLQPIYDQIVAITDTFCRTHLNEEYAQMSRKLAAALARKRPSPLARGRVETWACGIVYTIGSVNFRKGLIPYISGERS